MDLTEIKRLNYDHHVRMDIDRDSKPKHILEDRRRKRNVTVQQLMDRVPIEVDKMLELGCGVGPYKPLVKGRLKFGNDIHLPVLLKGRDTYGKRHTAWAASEVLPFKDSVFDLIFSRHSMEHVMPLKVLPEIKRILAPGRYVVQITPHRFPYIEPSHITEYNKEEWEALYIEHDFKIVYSKLGVTVGPEHHLVARLP